MARGASTSEAATRASSSVTWSLPSSAAFARAAASAISEARAEPMPSPSDAPHSALSKSSGIVIPERRSRAARMS
ncbi:MAG: hypothetical protein ACK55Z_25405, partial [bacterium]